MFDCLNGYIRFSWRQMLVVCALLAWGVNDANAWTSTHLFNVDVTVHVAPNSLSTVITDARFIVEAGHFHGFDLAEMPGGEIDKGACFAYRDDGRRYNVKFKKLRNGRTRVVLADDEEVKRGGITFEIAHRIDFVAEGAIQPHRERARFEWTPLIWNEGIDNMSVFLQLPKTGGGHIAVDRATSRDYVVEVGDTFVNFIKYRPVKWYAMKLVLDFDPRLVSGLPKAPEGMISNDDKPPSKGAWTASSSPPPLGAMALFPIAAVLVGFFFLVLKFRHVRSACRHVGLRAIPALLSRTSSMPRVALSAVALTVGLWVQYRGHLAAGIPAVTIAAALFVMRRKEGSLRPRSGGTWREMSDGDIAAYRHLTALYRKGRRSSADITTVRGMLTFVAFTGGLGAAAYTVGLRDTDLSWSGIIDGLILAVPAWFGSIRAELPVSPAFEGFHILTRWQRSLSRLLGAKTPGAKAAALWIREDGAGPIEVRLRAAVPVEGVNNLEVAGETVRAGSIYKTRAVFVFRLQPGTPVARKLSACPHAAEHHLTPDLREEIVVLRNRRGSAVSELAPLRTALTMLHS
jgi:hypothetical protein